MMARLFVFAVLLMASALVPACASKPRPVTDAGLAPIDSRSLVVYDGVSGEAVSWASVVRHAAAVDAVIIGENHGHPVGLPWAAALWEDISAASPNAALSMEFFERDDQSRLDDYLKGLTDEATFEKRTERKAGNYPPSHKAMVTRAKELGRPVIAANAPWEVIRFLRGKEYEALRQLTAEQQRLFKIPEAPPEGRYRSDFDAVMRPMVSGGHAAPGSQSKAPAMTEAQISAMLDRSFRSQYLWDWTMGESIARAIEAGNRPVVHVIGRFHSDFFGGTPQALLKLHPGARVLIVSVVDQDSDGLREEDRGRGDYVVYVGPSPKSP
jgi:uncharacterized iron-regulated protein